MSYLGYLCLLADSGVKHRLGCVCVLFVIGVCSISASFSRLFIFDCPVGISLAFIILRHTIKNKETALFLLFFIFCNFVSRVSSFLLIP
jgi:hypothetical protein